MEARSVLCTTRQLANSLTGNQANAIFGIRGATPRHPDKIGDWCTIFYEVLSDPANPTGIPAELLREKVKALKVLGTRLNEAREREAEAKVVSKRRGKKLKAMREFCDQEIPRIKKFLEGPIGHAGRPVQALHGASENRGGPVQALHGAVSKRASHFF